MLDQNNRQDFLLPADYFSIINNIVINNIGNNREDCKQFYFELQEKKGCFLCGEIHEIHFWCFVKRSYRCDTPDDSPDIFQIQYTFALRFLCLPNFEKRKKTGDRIQYTFTILPSFLIPYSRIPINFIIAAVTKYEINRGIKGSSITVKQFALIMLAYDKKTFYLHKNRMQKLLPEYNSFLRSEIIKYNGNIPAPPIKNRSDPSPIIEFSNLTNNLRDCIDKIPGSPISQKDDIIPFVFSLLYQHFTTKFWNIPPINPP